VFKWGTGTWIAGPIKKLKGTHFLKKHEETNSISSDFYGMEYRLAAALGNGHGTLKA